MNEDVITMSGAQPGPVSMVLVGVHGNERCGIEALQKLLPTIDIQYGTVYFAYGNPRAIAQNVRFTESNLNRMFKPASALSAEELQSYEYNRAQYLCKYLDQSEALLDIHASYTPASKPFLICEAQAKEISGALPFDLVVSGFDRVEPGGTDYYMNSSGKIGICAECGYLGDSEATQIAKQTITAFLEIRGHMNVQRVANPHKQRFIEMYELYITRSNFVLTRSFKDFEKLAKGEVIGQDGNESAIAKKDSVILFAKDIVRPGQEAFLLGEYKKT